MVTRWTWQHSSTVTLHEPCCHSEMPSLHFVRGYNMCLETETNLMHWCAEKDLVRSWIGWREGPNEFTRGGGGLAVGNWPGHVHK